MRSSRTASTAVAWAVATGSVAVAIGAVIVAVRDGLTGEQFLQKPLGFSVVLIATMPVLGAFVVTRHPGNRLGWVFCLFGPLRGIQVVADVWAHHAYVAAPGSWPGGSVASWLFSCGPLFLLPIAPLMVLWFPDGHAPAGRWRRLELAPAILVALLAMALVLAWPSRGPQLLADSPSLDGWRAPLGDVVVGAAIFVAVVSFVAAFASLISRLRHAEPAGRAEVKWFLFGAGAAFVLNIVGDFGDRVAPLRLVAAVLPQIFILIAIERYRLWEIDRLINRTVVYGSVTIFAAALYASAAISIGLVVGGAGARSGFAVAGATLLIAVLFAPARRRVQLAVDRRFDRRRFDAVARVRGFADRLGHDNPEPAELQRLLAEVLRDPELELCFVTSTGNTIDGAGTSVASPAETDERAVARIGDDDAPIGYVGHRQSLDNDGSLLVDVFRAARTSLEYARLQAELRVQLIAIQRSRTRLVEATDAERRRIERDLHDGAQQRLVALALRVRTEQRRHTVEPGTAADDLLSTTVDELQAAVAELRSMTQGMLPAVLASGGVGAALRELAGRYDGRVQLVAVPDHRHTATVEATAWFVASEGLTNAIKHAVDATVTLRAECHDGMLRIAVCDDGPGGATLNGSGIRGLGDRVDACGGQLTLRSPCTGGTELIAVLPCA
ncbi:MAG: histidine kinase [Acidimicrobiales bacterium]